MPWKKQFDVDVARERAKDLFWSKGYEATSMDDLLSHMGINRGSFYATFGSKRELYSEVLNRYDAEQRRSAFQALTRGLPAKEAIAAIFREVCRQSRGKRGKYGCFLANAALEMAPADESIGRLVCDAFSEMEGFLKELIEDGQRIGEINRRLDSADVSRALLGLLLGMRVLARSGASPKVLDGITRQAEHLLAPPRVV
jgi:TetR/AcrR family transcriptional repressor of nem operon